MRMLPHSDRATMTDRSSSKLSSPVLGRDDPRGASPRPWTRREALGAGLGAVSLVVLGCAARLPPVRDVPARGGELILALTDYPELQQPGGVLPVRPNGSGKPIMIVNEQGRFTAFSLKCTHMGCTVGWNDAARSFDCPCHGSRFAIDGTVMKGPAKRPLTALAVQADGTTLRVQLG